MVDKLLPGDYISFMLTGTKHSGLVLPQTTKETLFVKLENGYNIGIKYSAAKDVKKLKSPVVVTKTPTLKGTENLPKIAIITTGGTITSRVDYKTGAVHALTKPEELLAQIPELQKLATLKLISPFAVLSEDMTPKDWQELAKIVYKELKDKSVRGVIITHGTDTLHYTSAALAFMLGKLAKPVALVGGQRSSDRGSFDGAQNLICAVHYCLSDINHVAIVMHGSAEDKYCLALHGTKVRKMHTTRRDTFRPVNALPLAKIWSDGKIEKNKINQYATTRFSTVFEPKVALIKYAPGLDLKIFEAAAKESKGIILEGTGLGHVAVEGKASWLPAIKKAIKRGVFVGMTSQCLYGRTDPFVYSTGRILREAGVTYLGDMLSEVAYVKLGCAIARAKNSVEVKQLMLENWAGEISERIEKGTFLY